MITLGSSWVWQRKEWAELNVGVYYIIVSFFEGRRALLLLKERKEKIARARGGREDARMQDEGGRTSVCWLPANQSIITSRACALASFLSRLVPPPSSCRHIVHPLRFPQYWVSSPLTRCYKHATMPLAAAHPAYLNDLSCYVQSLHPPTSFNHPLSLFLHLYSTVWITKQTLFITKFSYNFFWTWLYNEKQML